MTRSIPFRAVAALLPALLAAACVPGAGSQEADPVNTPAASPEPAKTALATFGNGCFWCAEAVFEALEGVTDAVSGYSGGAVEKPTYEQVCSGATGHAEAVQVTYDPAKVTYEKLLEVFWKTHDPTTKNRQGNDVGTQYRSAIFWHTEAQKEAAERIRKELDATGAWSRPIVTEIARFEKFWPAEDYHQDYFRLNPQKGYCQAVIRPKMEKFRKAFGERLKTEK